MPVESLRRDTSPEAKRRENRFILDDDDDEEEEDEDEQGVGKRLGRECVMLDGERGREGARAMRAASE